MIEKHGEERVADVQAKKVGGSNIWQGMNDVKSAVGQYLAFCESKGKKPTDLSIFWNLELLHQHFDDWINFHKKHNGQAPSPHSLYNRATILWGWLKFIYFWKKSSNHPKLATAIELLSEKKKSYKLKIRAHNVQHYTVEKRAALDKFLEKEQVNKLCDFATDFLQWMMKHVEFERAEFEWFQRILLMTTYFLCGKSDDDDDEWC